MIYFFNPRIQRISLIKNFEGKSTKKDEKRRNLYYMAGTIKYRIPLLTASFGTKTVFEEGDIRAAVFISLRCVDRLGV